MKRTTAALLLLATAGLAPGSHAQSGLQTPKQRFSYGLGLQVARSLMQQGLNDVDSDALAAGVADVLGGAGPRLSPDELRAAGAAYQQEMMQESVRRAEANNAAGEVFMSANATKDGVTVLESGLQYAVLSAGTGGRPSETDTVSVHYRGRLLDGNVFDSSYERGEPTSLEVNGVIPGWQQALQLMPVGSKWEVWIPPSLAYGPRGQGAIGPNETLHFVIELVEIKADP